MFTKLMRYLSWDQNEIDDLKIYLKGFGLVMILVFGLIIPWLMGFSKLISFIF